MEAIHLIFSSRPTPQRLLSQYLPTYTWSLPLREVAVVDFSI